MRNPSSCHPPHVMGVSLRSTPMSWGHGLSDAVRTGEGGLAASYAGFAVSNKGIVGARSASARITANRGFRQFVKTSRISHSGKASNLNWYGPGSNLTRRLSLILATSIEPSLGTRKGTSTIRTALGDTGISSTFESTSTLCVPDSDRVLKDTLPGRHAKP